MLTLAHDVVIVLGLFALLHNVTPFSLQIDQAIIAALLTIVGYSINDTVVVFDRIREYALLFKTEPYETVANRAINTTLSRTILTSGTTLIAVLVLFLIGGEVLKGFSLALLVGHRGRYVLVDLRGEPDRGRAAREVRAGPARGLDVERLARPASVAPRPHSVPPAARRGGPGGAASVGAVGGVAVPISHEPDEDGPITRPRRRGARSLAVPLSPGPMQIRCSTQRRRRPSSRSTATSWAARTARPCTTRSPRRAATARSGPSSTCPASAS